MQKGKLAGGGYIVPLNKNIYRYYRLKQDIQIGYIDKFTIVYQPKINLRNNNIISWEILSRWKHNEYGYIPPIEFLSIIKELDKEYEFDMYVFEQMCKDISTIDCKENTYSINISTNSLKNKSIYTDILSISKKYKINPRQIIIEILENDQIDKYDEIIENINKLDEKGYKISIDDFGTGYSSYYRLCNINFKEIKIPREFLPKSNDDKDKKINILKGIVNMGKSLECEIVIEGIETVDDHNLAQNLDIDYGQGYLYSKPIPFKDISNL